MIRSFIFGLLIVLSLCVAPFAYAQSTDALLSQIQSLLRIVQDLQRQLASLEQNRGGTTQTQESETIASGNSVFTPLTQNLWPGLRDGQAGVQVSALQRMLRATGDYTYPEITGFFGPATRQAVERFQCREMLLCAGSVDDNGFGAAGPRTRAAIFARAANSGEQVPSMSYTWEHTNEWTACLNGEQKKIRRCIDSKRNVVDGALCAQIPSQDVLRSCTTTQPPGTIDTSRWSCVMETFPPQRCFEPSQNFINTLLWLGISDRETNGAVSLLQRTLRMTGDYTHAEITGFYGATTQEAVKRFQCREMALCAGSPEENGYGVVGSRTQFALNVWIEERSSVQLPQYTWRSTGNWSACVSGQQQQTIACMNSALALVDSVFCSQMTLPFTETRVCSSDPTPLDTYTWHTGTWSTCTNSSQTRTVQCKNNAGTVVADSFCTTSKPATTQSCTPQAQSCTFNGTAVAHGATVTAYAAASVPAGSTCQSQSRTCTNGTLSGTYTHAVCTVAGTPTTYTWHTGTWSTCTNSSQTRTVQCKNNAGTVVADSFCTTSKPATTQSCTVNANDVIVIFASGQSNMAAKIDSPQFTAPSNVFIWNYPGGSGLGDRFTNIIPQPYSALSWRVASEFARAYPQKTIYVINVAFSGRAIDTWAQGFAGAPPMYSVTRQNIDAALRQIPGNKKIDHFLWWQGESDVVSGLSSQYKAKFNQLEAGYITTGQFTSATKTAIFGLNSENNTPAGPAGHNAFNTILRQIANEKTTRFFIETGDLHFMDSLHISHTGQPIAAERAFRALNGGGATVTYTWHTGTWSTCTNSSQTRTVQCKNNAGTVVADSFCTTSKPATTQSCTPQAQSCTFNGTAVAHGATVTAYAAASVPAGSTCQSQSRTCTNGTLSGTYTHAVCTVGSGGLTPKERFAQVYPASWQQLVATFLGRPSFAQVDSISLDIAPPLNRGQGLPKHLIIGDSISLCYTPHVRAALPQYEVHRVPHNGASTENALASIEQYLEAGPWDLITVNWGLHDLSTVRRGSHPNYTYTYKTPEATYRERLVTLLTRLKNTGARVVWIRTTPTQNPVMPIAGTDAARLYNQTDVVRYNQIADSVVQSLSIPAFDLTTSAHRTSPLVYQSDNLHFQAASCSSFGTVIANEVRALANPPSPTTYTWHTGTWSTCTNSSQTRTVQCKNNAGTVVADSFCTTSKPATTQSCTTGGGTTCQANSFAELKTCITNAKNRPSTSTQYQIDITNHITLTDGEAIDLSDIKNVRVRGQHPSGSKVQISETVSRLDAYTTNSTYMLMINKNAEDIVVENIKIVDPAGQASRLRTRCRADLNTSSPWWDTNLCYAPLYIGGTTSNASEITKNVTLRNIEVKTDKAMAIDIRRINDMTIDSSEFIGGTVYGIYLHSNASYNKNNFTLTNSTVADVGVNGIVIHNTRGVRIENSVFRNNHTRSQFRCGSTYCGGGHIYVAASVVGGVLEDIVIRSNEIYNTDTSLWAYGFEVAANARHAIRNLTVTNNHFHDLPQAAIFVHPTPGMHFNFVLQPNRVD